MTSQVRTLTGSLLALRVRPPRTGFEKPGRETATLLLETRDDYRRIRVSTSNSSLILAARYAARTATPVDMVVVAMATPRGEKLNAIAIRAAEQRLLISG